MLSKELTAFILGVVEGLTEFIPVSSTGHLIIAGNMLGFNDDKAKLFEVFIQLGAIFAVVLLYPRFFLRLFSFRKSDSESSSFYGLNGLVKLGLAALPAFILGFLSHEFIKERLFNPLSVAIGLVGGSALILYAEFKNKCPSKQAMQDLTYLDCLLVGLFQCLALWPGFSRAGATIVGGLLIGFQRKLAAEFSFLLAVPVLTVAALYDVYKNYHLLGTEDISMFLIGIFTSFVVAVLAIKVFLNYLKNKDFKVFAYYRIILAVTVFIYW